MSINRQQGSGFGRKNAIINGNFDIWQRGTSAGYTAASGQRFLADRYLHSWSGKTSGTLTNQQGTFTVGQTEVPNNPTYYNTFTSSGISWGTDTWWAIQQRTEDVKLFAGQPATFSFYARADTTRKIGFYMNQQFGSGGSTEVRFSQNVITISPSWEKYSFTVDIPSVSGKTIGTGLVSLISLIYFASTGTITTALGFPEDIPYVTGAVDLAQVQLEQSSVATEFEHRPIGKELKLCQRYYEKSYDIDTVPGTITNSGAIYYRSVGSMATAPFQTIHFATPKRWAPTVTIYNPQTGAAGSGYNATAANSFGCIAVLPSNSSFVVNISEANPSFYTADLDYVRTHWTADAEL